MIFSANHSPEGYGVLPELENAGNDIELRLRLLQRLQAWADCVQIVGERGPAHEFHQLAVGVGGQQVFHIQHLGALGDDRHLGDGRDRQAENRFEAAELELDHALADKPGFGGSHFELSILGQFVPHFRQQQHDPFVAQQQDAAQDSTLSRPPPS